MSDKAGVRINGQFFPFVDQFKHGDPILIHEVTGLTWDQFSEMLAKAGDGSSQGINPIVQTALIAVAIQRERPTWSRREVSEFVRNLELGQEEYVGGETAEGDALPPSNSGVNSVPSDKTSPEQQEESPSSPNPTSSGDPGSATTSQESLRVA